jgi:NTP pyrophosphatase (non-canonical NTP hydrolase)
MSNFKNATLTKERYDATYIAADMFTKIRRWAYERGIYDHGDSKTQYVKLMEEAGELAEALLKNDKPEIIDAIGDMVVVLTNLAKLEKLDIEDCIENAYETISKRTGKMMNGTFVKNTL